MKYHKIMVAGLASLVMTACGSPAPSPTVTMTIETTATATTTVTKTASPPSPAAVTTFSGKPEDFVVPLRVTGQKCFGSAGCNVTYRVDTPTYAGTTPLPTSGTVEVTYRVQGGDESVIATFSVSKGQVEWDGEGRIRTVSEDAELSAEITDVTYVTY